MATVKRENQETKTILTITVTPKEYAPTLKKAATRLSKRVAVKGFRKGHTPYDIIKKEVGEMAILEEALEAIVQEQYTKAIIDEKIDTVGMPEINIEKMAPDNDVVFTAGVALLPTVTLPDIKKINIDRKEGKVDEKQMEETLNSIRGMHAKEIIKDGAAEGTDKLVVDMTMTQDKVIVEGGQTKDYQVYLGEDHYIPGFNEKLAGAKKGDTKLFTLSFPKTHYQKQLAGKKIDFEVLVKEVYTRELPTLDDEFAKKLGQKSIEELKKLIKENMLNEATQKATQQEEIEILDILIEKTTFSEIPEILLESEKNKIFQELKQNLSKNGITIEQYLQDMKKKEEELRKDFSDQAQKRAKAALISRQVAQEQNIIVADEDLDKEVEMLKDVYKDNKEAQENLKRQDVRDTIAISMQNRQVMQWLKEQILKDSEQKKTKK